jgi:hypothetical protein
MGTFPELRAAALALNKACGSLSIHFIDGGNVLRLGKALQRWEPVIGTPLTDGSGMAEHEVRADIHMAAIWLYAAVVAVLEQPEREDLQALAQQRVRDYHLEVLRAAVAYHWLPAPPGDRAAG